MRAMRYDTYGLNRRSIRLPGYDYASGGSYYITIRAHNRECLFGEVVDGKMRLNEYGEIVRDEWERSGEIRHGLVVDAHVIMPNHLHGIVTIVEERNVGAHSCAPLPNDAPLPNNAPLHANLPRRPPRSIASFVAQFKATATRRINGLRDTQGARLWQRNYYEHVVRDEDDFYRIQAYIEDNPGRWAEDEYHPSRA